MPPPREQLIDILLGSIRDDLTRAGAAAAPDPAAALLGAVAKVEDGDVISAEHHNALRAAVAYLLEHRGDSGGAAASVLSFSAALLPMNDRDSWDLRYGMAVRPASDAASYAGWMPLELPHGARLEVLTVAGSMPDPVQGGWFVGLCRRDKAATRATMLFGQSLTNSGDVAPGPFEIAIEPTRIEDETATQVAERLLVDRTRYQYFFHSSVSDLGGQWWNTQLRLVQVGISRAG